MKKSLIWSLLLALVQLSLASCSETEEANVFENWEARNVEYITSIKDKAVANAEGNWVVVKDYNYASDAAGTTFNGVVGQYVYAQRLVEGEGTESPLFTDSVYVSYCGQLMPYKNLVGETEITTFQKTFYANPVDVFETGTDKITMKTLAPQKFYLGGLTTGFASALMHMHKGDVWKIYVPYQLGYGSVEQTSIPAYSTLIFYVYLQGFYPAGTPMPAWR